MDAYINWLMGQKESCRRRAVAREQEIIQEIYMGLRPHVWGQLVQDAELTRLDRRFLWCLKEEQILAHLHRQKMRTS